MHLRIFAVTFVLAATAFAQSPSPSAGPDGRRPFTFEDMMALKRVAEPVPSPDGRWVVFAAQNVDLDANKKKSHLWIVPAASGAASTSREALSSNI